MPTSGPTFDGVSPRGVSRRRVLTFARASAPPPPTGHWIRVHRTAMACRFEVVLPGEDAEYTPAAIAALDEADRLEALLTIFRDTSEISRLNRGAAEAELPAGRDVLEVLRRSRDIFELTGGAFDVTSGPLSRCWGFLQREGRCPSDDSLAAARSRVGMDAVAIDEVRRTVRFRRPGIELNLGSIGKGYALDRMAAGLAARGVRHALLSAGGSSILALGADRHGWPIDLRPRLAGPGAPLRVCLRDGAIATSGAGEQFFEIDGRRYGHVIDPRSGWPASGVLSASVVASDAATADALSTAMLIGGPSLAEHCCRARPETLALMSLEDDPTAYLAFGAFAGARLVESGDRHVSYA